MLDTRQRLNNINQALSGYAQEVMIDIGNLEALEADQALSASNRAEVAESYRKRVSDNLRSMSNMVDLFTSVATKAAKIAPSTDTKG